MTPEKLKNKLDMFFKIIDSHGSNDLRKAIDRDEYYQLFAKVMNTGVDNKEELYNKIIKEATPIMREYKLNELLNEQNIPK